jgi:putative methionine-R-sulfoxide reductase with GAF domain
VTTSAAAGDQLRRIDALTDSSLARLGVEDLLDELLDRVCDVLRADTATVLLLDLPAQELVATAAKGLEDEVRQGVRISVGRGFAGRVAAEQKPLAVEHLEEAEILDPILAASGVRSLLGVPLIAGGATVGVLHVGTFVSRRFTDADIDLLQLVADRVALAVQTRLSNVERAASRILSRGLQPARLPQVPGAELSARYIPGEGQVGGDWYDVFTVPAGGLSVVIGDVAGHGLPAAVIMGRLRSALRAYALDRTDPADVLTSLDRKIQHFEPGAMATVLYARFEPTMDRAHISLAGHFPPVLAIPGQPSTLVDAPVDLPLGVRPTERRTTTIDFLPGALLCFFTDGLIERRDSSIDADLERLREVVVAAPADVACSSIMARLAGADHDDDIALLTLRRTPS